MTSDNSKEMFKKALSDFLYRPVFGSNEERIDALLRLQAGESNYSVILKEGGAHTNKPWIEAIKTLREKMGITEDNEQQAIQELMDALAEEARQTKEDRSDTGILRFHDDLVSPSFVKALTKVLDIVDCNRIRYLFNDFVILQSQFTGEYENMFLRSPSEGGQLTILETALKLRKSYSQFIDEIEQCRIDKFLLENAEKIKFFASKEGLHLFDALFLNQLRKPGEPAFPLNAMLDLAKKTNLLVETDLGRRQLEELTTEIIVRSINEDAGEQSTSDNVSKSSKRMKKIAALGKVSIGACLAAASIGAGLLVGGISSLIGEGFPVAAGAVGIAVSTYTGLNTACDGFKDWATANEPK